MWPNPEETADLVTFTEEILNGKLHFLCSVMIKNESLKSNEVICYRTEMMFSNIILKGSIFFALAKKV